ncbi:sn-glycerol-3-phosphate ABC transporter ATP-binding protein UgpC [candidate division GN15 bacterium]|uniref:sn-glycerol-3-phosphate ABC transporter ATP-binding protein UgpC n=1 Tax=candidate division GN15 bacterium TaxID=2072418 RepID=A0A855X2F2_9BACT|nr:MAG: sn-glycerol-3-phosphate ABC transporter ATP-binding protein UgpC [candidate division GN15 bacterium]
MPGLVLKEVSKSFGTTVVLDRVSLELAEGELLVVLGASGCGKSTLLRLISGLEECDSGEIYVNDQRVDQLRPRERNVALVFQNYSLYPHMSVAKNLAFPLEVAKLPKADIKERVRKTAEMLGLADRLKDKPGQLSGGQRQRVALGRAIIREPAIFLLDEPLSNLDAELRLRMRQEIVKLQRELGRTMIHVTHDQIEALTMADRIALLDKGKLIQVGTPEELYQKPATSFVASFIGQPKINLIEVTAGSGRTTPLEIKSMLTGKFLLGIRPESINLDGAGIYEGSVESVEYLGDQYVVRLKCGELMLTVSQLTHEPRVGDSVKFSLKREELLWFDAGSGARITEIRS